MTATTSRISTARPHSAIEPATRRLASPLGTLVVVAVGDALVELRLPGESQAGGLAATAPAASADAKPRGHVTGADEVLGTAAAQLDAYFAGTLRAFDVPLRLDGTPFQRQVWRALQDIPFGTTISYGELASRLGRPGAARAVGRAVGRNPLPIIVPCHRVIGADGSLTGFGGGLEAKAALLRLEGSLPS